MPHGVGIIDQDYHGPGDEVMIQVQRMTKGETIVKRGDKIAQGVFVAISNYIEWGAGEELRKTSRGGFGSTDG